MTAVTTPSPGDAAKSVSDWCTLDDAGGLDVYLKPIPFGFVSVTAGTITVQGKSGNDLPLVVAAGERVSMRVKKFVSGGSTTLTDTDIWLLY